MDPAQPPTTESGGSWVVDQWPADEARTGPATDLRFPGTYVLSAGPGGPTAIPGLELRFDDTGLTVARTDGRLVWQVPWNGLSELSIPERSRIPGAGDGVVVLVATGDDRRHRFVVPVADPAATEVTLGALAAAHDLVPQEAGRRLPVLLVLAVVLVTAAAVAALLLAAGHVVHY